MNSLLETASRAWPRIRKFRRRRVLVLVLGHIALDRFQIGLRPRLRAVAGEQFVDRVCGLHPVEQPGKIARLRGWQRVQGIKIEDATEQRGDLRPGQVRPLALFRHPFDVDPEGLRRLARDAAASRAPSCASAGEASARRTRSTLDLPSVIKRFLALVLWPLGKIDRSRQLAEEAASAPGEKRALAQVNALVHRAVFDGLRGGMLQGTETILALAGDHAMPLYMAAGTHLNGLAKWRARDRTGGLAEMGRGWALLHENDCYLCEPFWGMQVAVANADAGQLDTGLEILGELIGRAEKTGQHWLDAELHRVRGEFLLRRDPSNVSAAEDAFNRALEIARSQQTKTFELRSALGLARIYIRDDQAAAASRVLAPAFIDFAAGQDLLEIEEAQKLLSIGSS